MLSPSPRRAWIEISFVTFFPGKFAVALLGWVILRPLFNEIILGILLAGVAGIMVYVSFDELLPSAREYGEHHLSLYGLILGMVVMAACLLLFA